MNTHAPTEEKNDDSKDRLHDELEQVFDHFPVNGTIFEKKVLNIKCVFLFSLQLSYETFLILRII